MAVAIHYTRQGFVALVEGAASVPVAELVAFLDDLAANDAARVVVLLLPSPAGSGEGLGVRAYGPDDLYALALTPLPAIAALSGPVRDDSLLLASACDIRVCDSATTFSLDTEKTPGLAGIPRPHQERRFPSPTAVEEGSEVRAEPPANPGFDAAVALNEGLVSEVTPPGEALARALQLAETIASRGPIATRLAKEALWRGRAMPLAQALRFETDLTLLLQTTKDRAEGVSAFIEKRKPTFTGN